MNPVNKKTMDKIISIKLAKDKETVGPGSFVVLKRHVRAGGEFHAKTRVGRVEKIDGDQAIVYFRYNDRRKGSSRTREIGADKLHLINTSTAHKLHKNLFKGLTDETPKPVAAEKPAAVVKPVTIEKPVTTEKPVVPDAPPSGDGGGDKGDSE